MKTQSLIFPAAVALFLVLGQEKEAGRPNKPRGLEPSFVLIGPTPEYNARLKAARDSDGDYFWKEIQGRPEGPTYDNVKDFLAPIKYVDAPWRYIGLILSPKGSTEKMRVIENGFQVDANLTRRSPTSLNAWAPGDTHLWVCVGPNDELFGLDEHRQRQPYYEGGYLPVFRLEYEAGGTTYEETVLAHPLIAEYRSPYLDEAGIAAYLRLTARSGPGQVAFEVNAPAVRYGGLPLAPPGFRDDKWTDAQNAVYAWFSRGGAYDPKENLVRFALKQGESAYVILPHQLQSAGTRVRADATNFEKARAAVVASWSEELAKGGRIDVPEKVVMDAYRSLLIGNWQVSIGDELPYGIFNYYQGNAYAEAWQYLAPFIEYGYFEDARRFIQPILEYPSGDTGVGFHAAANQLELAAYYYAMSGDAGFIRRNQRRLVEIAEYFLAHRQKGTGLIVEGYSADQPHQRVVNLNTNSNGWRAIRDLGRTLEAIGEKGPGARLLLEAENFGKVVRQAVLDNIDRSVDPPFVPFALGVEKPYASLVESNASSYYNIVMPYFFGSEIFDPKSEAYTDTLEYMWKRQGVMAGLNRFNQHSSTFAQDGIHPSYTWGRQFAQIARHDAERAVYTFYCSLAHGYTRGTFLTGECQGTVPSDTEWYRGTYMPPEPTANALLLRSLRHMLLHEHDRDQDGVYDELWLLSSAPRGWLEQGKTLGLDRMPSRFGPVSLKLRSALANGRLAGEVRLPAGVAGKDVLLFVRLPRGYQVKKASLDNGTVLRQSQRDGDAVISLPARAGTERFSVELVK